MNKIQKKTSENYHISIKSNGRKFESEGKTLEEALNKIKISGGVKVVSVITVKKGEKEIEKILSPHIAGKLFGDASPTMRIIALKKITELIGL